MAQQEGGINGVFWLVIIAALAIVGAFIVFNGQNKLSKAKPIVITAAVIAFIVLLFLFFVLNKVLGYGMKDLSIGYWGTFAGFIAALFGVQFLKDHAPANAES